MLVVKQAEAHPRPRPIFGVSNSNNSEYNVQRPTLRGPHYASRGGGGGGGGKEPVLGDAKLIVR